MSPQQMILSLLDKKITQEQIAKYVGVDQSTISRYAKGQNPSWHIAEKIKETFEKLSKYEAQKNPLERTSRASIKTTNREVILPCK